MYLFLQINRLFIMNKRKFLILNKYQIDYTNLLGKGAMGKVYLGYYKTG